MFFEVTITVTMQAEFWLAHRKKILDAELKGIITMRYSETLVKTCTARVLGLPAHSGGERTARVRTAGWVRGTEEQRVGGGGKGGGGGDRT